MGEEFIYNEHSQTFMSSQFLAAEREVKNLAGGAVTHKIKMNTKSFFRFLILCLTALQQTQSSNGARILAAFVFPGKSHFMMTNAIIKELVARGNEVTFITPFTLSKENLGKNYTEVLIPQFDLWAEVLKQGKVTSIVEMSQVSTFTLFSLIKTMGTQTTKFALERPEVKAFINDPNPLGKYDLLLAEEFYNEPALALAKVYQIPVVTVSTFGISNYMSSLTGVIMPWSYVPSNHKAIPDRMSFFERLDNLILCAGEDLFRKFYYYPAQDELIREHFSHLPGGAPTVYDLQRNISAILLNTYMPLVTPRPISFNMIQVGGLHIKKTKPLPNNIKQFLDGAEHGVIYFSLGSQVRSADMAPENIKAFINVFASLKQRVIWKFENEHLPNRPDNVLIQDWLPQNDILAHPKVKVFITHGGLFGTQEAVYHGVPMLGMPVYSDQHLNVNKGKLAGYALALDHSTITEDNLKSSLLELLENPKYQRNMALSSSIFRARPSSAMDTAIYWIDYVIEQRGAPHLVATGLDLAWYQFYLLDIIGFILTIIIIIILVPILVIRRLLRKKVCPKKKQKRS